MGGQCSRAEMEAFGSFLRDEQTTTFGLPCEIGRIPVLDIGQSLNGMSGYK